VIQRREGGVHLVQLRWGFPPERPKKAPLIMIKPRPAAWTSILICLGLAVCGAPPQAPHWVKAGPDDPTIEREVYECEAQANNAFASQRAVIDKKVGLSWMLQGFAVVPLQRQIMLREAAKRAEEVFNSCMRVQGFTKEE
jgi:hypothetical protein